MVRSAFIHSTKRGGTPFVTGVVVTGSVVVVTGVCSLFDVAAFFGSAFLFFVFVLVADVVVVVTGSSDVPETGSDGVSKDGEEEDDSDSVGSWTVEAEFSLGFFGIKEEERALRHFLLPCNISLSFGVLGIDRGVLGVGVDSLDTETILVSPEVESRRRYVLLTILVSQFIDSCCLEISSLRAFMRVTTC